MPQYGLPFQKLPGTAGAAGTMTPELTLNEQTQTGRRQIQDKYALQWKTVQQSKRFIGQTKTNQMLRQIDMNAKQEMLQFNQKMQAQANQLDNINRLAQQGAITNPEEIKARMTFGTDVARSMYPKEASIPEQFGKLDVYSHRIDQELEWFKEDKPSKPLGIFAGISPLTTAISVYRSRRKPKRKVKIWDPATEDYTIEATPEKIAEYDMWLREKRDIAARKRELLGQPDITRRTAGATRSGFDAGITESIRPQRAPAVTKPKIIRQRNTRTGQIRISYDGGKTWQTSG